MKIVVLMKYVPDTETKIKLTPQGGLDKTDFKYMINPYDEFAIEEAIQTQEKQKGETIILACGPTHVQEGMRKALAMGIDKGIWIKSDSEVDSWGVAQAIAQVLQTEKPDVIFAGQKAIDDDSGHIGPMVAELLGCGHVQVVSKVTWQGDKALVEREVEGGMIEVLECSLPVILGAHKSLNQPRFPTLPNIMKAKKKTIQEIPFPSLTSIVQNTSYFLPTEKPPGKIFKGKPIPDMVKEVVGLLRTEAKVI